MGGDKRRGVIPLKWESIIDPRFRGGDDGVVRVRGVTMAGERLLLQNWGLGPWDAYTSLQKKEICIIFKHGE